MLKKYTQNCHEVCEILGSEIKYCACRYQVNKGSQLAFGLPASGNGNSQKQRLRNKSRQITQVL